ncbi:hypothetical protein [Vibrio sp. Hal054]|uniref:hypothetical protein n=1 Tax=Vibrio sp. Hal054 TaxID=3035158 RepID=UPI00301BFC96
MLHIDQRITELTQSLKAHNDAYYVVKPESIRFGLYLAFLKKGYCHAQELAFDELLANVPSEYLPCSLAMTDSYHISTSSVRTIVMQYSELASFDVCEQDANAILSVVDALPLSLNQINTQLIEKEVITRPISANAFCELVAQISDHSVSSFRVYPSSAKASYGAAELRSERFSRDAVLIVCLTSGLAVIKALFAKLIRASEKLSAITYALDVQCITNLHANHQNNKPCIHIDTLMAVLSTRDDFHAVSPTVCILSHAHTSKTLNFVTMLVPYVRTFKTVATYQLPTLFRRFFDFRLNVSNQELAKVAIDAPKSVTDKVSTVDFAYHANPDFFCESVALACLNHSGFFVVKGNEITLQSHAPAIQLSSYWQDMLLTFCHEHSDQVECFYNSTNNSGKHIANDFAAYCATQFKAELYHSLLSPNGFFVANDVGYSITPDCELVAQNHRGDYLEPDASQCALLISEIEQQLYSLRQLGKGLLNKNKTALDAKFKKKTKPRPTLYDLYYDTQYVSQLKNLIVSAHGLYALSFIRSDSSVCEKAANGYKERLNYIVAQMNHEGLEHSTGLVRAMTNLQNKLDACTNRIEVNESLKQAVLCSPLYKEFNILIEQLVALKEQRHAMKITGRQYKAPLFIHDFLAGQTKAVSVEEVSAYIEDYCASLLDSTSVAGSSWYRNSHVIFTTHPYSIPPR